MCSHMDAVQTAVIFCEHVVFALRNSAFDVGILFHGIHYIYLLSAGDAETHPDRILPPEQLRDTLSISRIQDFMQAD